MKKAHLSLLAFLLIHLFAAAQSKKPDRTSDLFDGEWRRLGGYLTVHYDGERLRLNLMARFPDTNSLAKEFIKKKNDGQWFSSTMGKMKIGDREVNISFTSSDITYEVHDHIMQFNVTAHDIPVVVNGSDFIDILLWEFSPDSAVFVCTGKESIDGVQPEPTSFTNKQANWMATDTNRLKRHCEYAVSLESSDKGVFGFSRLSMRQANQLLSLFWDRVTSHLLILVSFWYLWYLLVAGRAYFEKVDPRLVKCIIKWVPWLAGFYLVIIFDNIVSATHAMETIKMSKSLAIPEISTWKWRAGFVVSAVVLLCFQLFWRRGARASWVVLLKALCKTVAYSMLAYVLIGALIQFTEYCLDEKNPLVDVNGYIRLEVGARYAVWAIAAFYLYIIFVFYKLFAFNRAIQVIVIALTILFAFKEPYRIMGDAETEKSEHSISFSYPIKKIGETNKGSLNLNTSFMNQADMFYCIPFLLTIYLIVQLSRRKDQQKAMVIMASLFFLFYCCYLIPVRETFLLFPVTLVAAIFLHRLVMVGDKRARYQLIQTGNQLYTQELNDMKIFRKMPELRKSVKLKERYRQRRLDGDLLPADYDKAVADIDKLVGEPGAENIQRRMEFGPFQDPLRNGLSALGYGLLVSGLFYLVYFKFYLIETHYELNGIPEVLSGETTNLLVQHLAPVVLHGLAGFCMGYFFPFLKGNSGWEKGAWLGTAMGLAHLPIIYFTVENAGWAPLAGIFFKHVIILMITGFLACDLATIRKIYGRRYSWKDVVHVMGWKRTLTLGASVMTAIGSGITSWISESVLEALKSFLVN
jgi:hypothetical protein